MHVTRLVVKVGCMLSPGAWSDTATPPGSTSTRSLWDPSKRVRARYALKVEIV